MWFSNSECCTAMMPYAKHQARPDLVNGQRLLLPIEEVRSCAANSCSIESAAPSANRQHSIRAWNEQRMLNSDPPYWGPAIKIRKCSTVSTRSPPRHPAVVPSCSSSTIRQPYPPCRSAMATIRFTLSIRTAGNPAVNSVRCV